MRHPAVSLIGVALQLSSICSALADAPLGRYAIADETVRDNRTLLMWQRLVPADSYSQSAAVNYCLSLILGGYSDWRLPTRAELASLPDSTRVNPAIDVHAFPSTPLAWFWTSSNYVERTETGWSIDFVGGASMGRSITEALRVRCVR